MNKKLSIVIIIVCVMIVSGISLVSKKLIRPTNIHYHAGFTVFQNNKKLDFSDTKYMFIKPCTASGKEEDDPNNLQIEKAHLHDNVGDLVHIEESGARWKDLFTNIHFLIDEKSTKGYLNGKFVPSFLSMPIHPNDSLVVFIGENDPKHLQEAVTTDYITKMAKKSSTCGE